LDPASVALIRREHEYADPISRLENQILVSDDDDADADD
jgi:hypothetical protein